MNRCFVTFVAIVVIVIVNLPSIVAEWRSLPLIRRRSYIMWYAVWVETGREETIKQYCKQYMDSSIYCDIFVLRFNRLKKFYGKWHKESKVMFPGYIFIDTETPELVYEAFKRIPAFVSLLGKDRESFTPIEKSKEALFRSMIDETYEIAVSTGFIEGDKVTITEGPLAGKEAMIKRIDRHKRIAVLDVEMFGERIGVTVGLEVVEKK